VRDFYLNLSQNIITCVIALYDSTRNRSHVSTGAVGRRNEIKKTFENQLIKRWYLRNFRYDISRNYQHVMQYSVFHFAIASCTYNAKTLRPRLVYTFILLVLSLPPLLLTSNPFLTRENRCAPVVIL